MAYCELVKVNLAKIIIQRIMHAFDCAFDKANTLKKLWRHLNAHSNAQHSNAFALGNKPGACHMYIHVICTNMPYVHTCSRHMRRDQVYYKMLTNYCGVLQHYHFHVIECLFYPLSDIYATVHYLYWTTYTTYEIMQKE